MEWGSKEEYINIKQRPSQIYRVESEAILAKISLILSAEGPNFYPLGRRQFSFSIGKLCNTSFKSFINMMTKNIMISYVRQNFSHNLYSRQGIFCVFR